MKRIISFIFLSLLSTFSVSALPLSGSIVTPSYVRMLNDLEFIKNAFEIKYAPRFWKQEFCAWDLSLEYEKAKNGLASGSKSDLKAYHRQLKKFLQSTKDYHVGITFYSTERATLPFTIKGSKGRYFIVDIDREGISATLQNLLNPMATEGDEIIKFGSEPIDVVIQRIKREELAGNTSETDQALAELMLTHRSGTRGEKIPQGKVDITVKKRFTDTLATYTYEWNYTPEKIGSVQPIMLNTSLNTPHPVSKQRGTFHENDFFNKMMVSPLFLDFAKTHRDDESKYHVGSRVSFVPRLGKKIWESDEGSPFDAYIFAMPSTSSLAGTKIGYIRVPHFMAGEDEAEEFCEILSQMQWRTEALVIDQINNPGGSIFYLYALASMLTDKPLFAPRHHIAITQQEVFTAHNLLAALEDVTDDASAKEIIGDNLGGYPVDFQFATLLKQFSQYMISEWESGNHYTGTTHLFGVDEIMPHPKGRYTKPLLVLSNSLDFSGADFFPAILQDNKRAKILGTRTAGAGGYVLVTQFPNRTGIALFSMTGSLAERKNLKPIENLGVTPDIPYECTPGDIEGNYEEYANAILKGIESICGKS